MTDITMQPMLFDSWVMVAPAYEEAMTIRQRFEMYDAANPWVYAKLRDLALGLRRKGVQRYAIDGLVHVLRWDYMQRTDDPTSDFKINNDYRALYARKLMEREPELSEFFETRVLRSE